jgi:AmiR/NasT family two-component response regulator
MGIDAHMAQTPPPDRSVPRYSDEEVDEIIARRATIEQAKGVLMYALDVDADQAFKMLLSRARSNQMNLGLLAKLIADDPEVVEEFRY